MNLTPSEHRIGAALPEPVEVTVTLSVHPGANDSPAEVERAVSEWLKDRLGRQLPTLPTSVLSGYSRDLFRDQETIGHYACVQCGRRSRTVLGVWVHTYLGGWICNSLRRGRDHG